MEWWKIIVIFAILGGIVGVVVTLLTKPKTDPSNVNVDPKPEDNVFAVSFPDSTVANNSSNASKVPDGPSFNHKDRGLTLNQTITNSGLEDFGRLVASDPQNGTLAISKGQNVDIYEMKDDGKYAYQSTIDIGKPIHRLVFSVHRGATDLITRLFVVTGIYSDPQQSNIWADTVHIYRFQVNKWVLRSSTTNPLETTSAFRATFGDAIQIVLDDNIPTSPKISVYVRGSKRSGIFSGSLYWFVLNEAADTLSLLQTLTDQYLAQKADQPGFRLETTEQDYLNGFGRSFYVTSGLGKRNKIVVGNPLGGTKDAYEDGYVQMFTYDDQLAQWSQPVNDTGNHLRIAYPGIPGFGHTVSYSRGYVITSPASRPSIYVYDIQPNKVESLIGSTDALVQLVDNDFKDFHEMYPVERSSVLKSVLTQGAGKQHATVCSGHSDNVNCVTLAQYDQTLRPVNGRMLYMTYVDEPEQISGVFYDPSSVSGKPFASWKALTNLTTTAKQGILREYNQLGQSVSSIDVDKIKTSFVYISDPLRKSVRVYVTPI